MVVSMALGLALAASACVRQVPQAAGAPSPATVAIEVKSGEWHLGELDVKLAGMLKGDLLKAGIGVPVVEGSPADLTLKVMITDTTMTTAVAYEWQLVENASGKVIHAGNTTSLLGDTAEAMDQTILEDLVGVDTLAFASDKGAVMPGKRGEGPVDEPADSAPGAPPASGTDGSASWAVVIGIESYRNDLAKATGAEADARAFAIWAHGTLGVPENHIKVLLGERATRADMSGALEEWLPRNAVQPGGRVYVFFSGHGAPDIETGDAYLVPWEADPAYLKSGGFAVSGLQRSLSGLEGQEVFVFLDACFSGSGARSVLASGTRPLVPVKAVAAAPRVFTLTAAGAGEATGTHATSGHGLFTFHLLAGMGGAADSDGDRSVSFGELARYVATQVETEARQDNRDQKPTLAVPKGADVNAVKLVTGLAR